MKLLLVLAGFLMFNRHSPEAKVIQSANSTEELPIQYPNGFVRYEDYCYRFFSQHLSWIEAVMFCRMFDSDLARLYTERQYDFLKFQLKSIAGSKYGASGFWLGATDAYSPAHWIWIKEKTELEFENWGGQEPSLSTDGCLGLSKSSSFREARFDCGRTALHPICEKMTSIVEL